MKSLSKVCTRCHKTKNRDCFTRNSRTRDGLQAWCRACYKEYSASWYTHNSKRVLEEKKKQYARLKYGQPPLRQ